MQPPVWNKLIPYRIKTFVDTNSLVSFLFFFAADVPKICRSNVFKSHRYAPTAYCDADSISITGTGSPIMHFDKGCPFHCGAPSSAVQSISDDDPNRICYRHRLTGSSISLIGAFAGPLDADKRSRIPLDFFFHYTSSFYLRSCGKNTPLIIIITTLNAASSPLSNFGITLAQPP